MKDLSALELRRAERENKNALSADVESTDDVESTGAADSNSENESEDLSWDRYIQKDLESMYGHRNILFRKLPLYCFPIFSKSESCI